MRKKITLLVALAFMGTLAVSAATPEKKVAEITSKKNNFGEDGSIIEVKDSYYETFFYDKNGNETTYTKYNDSSKARVFTSIAKKYDAQNRLIRESDAYGVTTYIYDEATGQLKEKVKMNTYSTTPVRTTFKYQAGKLVSEETKKDGSDDKESSVTYQYGSDSNREWTIKSTYGYVYVYDGRAQKNIKGYVISQTNKSMYEKGKLVSDTLTRYDYTKLNADGTALGDPSLMVRGYSHYIFNEDGTAKSDTIWSYDDTRSKVVPQKVLEYHYANGVLDAKTEYGLSETSAGKVGFAIYFTYAYKYSPVGVDYVPTITDIASGSEFASIVITFTAPKVTEGLQGYKLVIDGVVQKDVLKPTGNTLTIAGQTRGKHDFSLAPVYEGLASACASDEFAYTVNIDLAAPKNLRVASYTNSAFGWDIKCRWDAPDANGTGKLTGYRMTSTTTDKPDTEQNQGKDIKTLYRLMRSQPNGIYTYRLYAVYEEGESDPIILPNIDLTDKTKVLVDYSSDNIAELKKACDGLTEPGELTLNSEAQVKGIVYDANSKVYGIYIEDSNGALKLTGDALFDSATGKAKVEVQQKIKNVKGIMAKSEGGFYEFKCTSWDNAGQGDAITPTETSFSLFDYGVTATQSKLYSFAGVRVEVKSDDKGGYYGMLTQSIEVSYDDQGNPVMGDVTFKMVDPSGKVFAAGKGYGESDITGAFVEIDAEGKPYWVLRSADDFDGDALYTSLQGIKEIKEPSTYTGKALVIGKVANFASFVYFLKDESGTISGMMKFGIKKAPALGDSITNVLFHSYSKADGFMCDSVKIISSGNAVEPEARTLAQITENGDADDAKFVKISNAVFACKLSSDGSFAESLTLTQGEQTMSLIYRGDEAVAELNKMNGKHIDINCYVSDKGLRLGALSDITVLAWEAERANLKEVKEGNTDDCVVKSKVFVIGKIVNLNSYVYLLQDGTVNISMMLAKTDVEINKGDSLANMRGHFEENTFFFTSADVIAKSKEVIPENRTLAQIKANGDADDAHYVYVEKVTLNFELAEDGSFKKQPTLTENGVVIEMNYYGNDAAAMKEFNGKVVNVRCYVLNGKLRLADPVKTEIEEVRAISTIGADRFYVANGNIVAEGAVGVTVYDMTGRALVASESNRVSVAGLNGSLIVRAKYANGEVKVSKIIVK